MTYSTKINFQLLDANKLVDNFNFKFGEKVTDDVKIYTCLSVLLKNRSNTRYNRSFNEWRSVYFTSNNEEFFNKVIKLIKECEL